MIIQFALSMVFVGLLQTLAMWALASRWMKITLIFGGLGIAYWLILFFFGLSPTSMLRIMPVASGIALVGLSVIWLLTMRSRKTLESA